MAAMKSPILSFVTVVTLSFGALNAAYADSATWNANPVDNDWSNPANWTPTTVPNGAADTATFGVSSRTNVSITAPIQVNSIVFTPGASAFTITPSPVDPRHPSVLTISGAGITNDSGITQNFVTSGDEDIGSSIIFTGFATAGNGTVLTNNGGPQLYNSGHTDFYDNASAGTAVVVNNSGYWYGATTFHDNSTAGDATIIANGAFPPDVFGGTIQFDSPNAGNATLIANGGENNGGVIVLQGGGSNTARVELYDNGRLITGYDSNSVVGSIEGDGEITLAVTYNLSVGNNLNTLFSGVIQDDTPPNLESSSVAGQMQPKLGGTLTKLGTGRLKLTGANTYSSGTKVKAGTLVVANAEGSGTGRGLVKVTTGRLGGSGIIAGETTIGTGSGIGAVLAPAAGTTVQATLTIQSALTFNSDATYTCTFGANRNRAETDQVVANGVTINSGAMVALSGHTRGVLRQGMVLTLISNTSANPISGTFSNLPDGGIVTINGNNFQASYSGGDGNDLTLTVVP